MASTFLHVKKYIACIDLNVGIALFVNSLGFKEEEYAEKLNACNIWLKYHTDQRSKNQSCCFHDNCR